MTTGTSTPAQTLLEEIDTQQNELLDQLDALNVRVETILRDCLCQSRLKVLSEPV